MNSIVKRYGTVLRCFDNGGRSYDRFTIMPPRWAKQYRERKYGEFVAIASSERPFHPQGFGQHCTAVAGQHLGKRIHWDMLPPDVQEFARQAFPEFVQIDN